jgi:hypothetical protein
MENIVQAITKLTEEWHFLIGDDHHKDRDCHWYIETKWSYGQSPVYSVQHYGYILDDLEDVECASYEEALKTLKKILIEKVEEEKKIKEEGKEQDEW